MTQLASRLLAGVLALAVLGTGCDDGSGGGGGDGGAGDGGSSGGLVGSEAIEMTNAHNQVRHNVSPVPPVPIPDVAWSTEVAATAQAWADNCKFQHSGSAYGENIYAVAGTTATPTDVVTDWASESVAYDYSANTCSSVCGHYTQVVWRDTQRIGCAKATCTKNSPFAGFSTWEFWVCNYDPAGNYGGQRPY